MHEWRVDRRLTLDSLVCFRRTLFKQIYNWRTAGTAVRGWIRLFPGSSLSPRRLCLFLLRDDLAIISLSLSSFSVTFNCWPDFLFTQYVYVAISIRHSKDTIGDNRTVQINAAHDSNWIAPVFLLSLTSMQSNTSSTNNSFLPHLECHPEHSHDIKEPSTCVVISSTVTPHQFSRG